jgi:hypothetical protein
MRRLRRVGYRTVKAPRTSPIGTYVFDPDTFGSASLGGSAGGAFSASWPLARLHFDAAWVRFGTIGLRPVWIPRPDVLELRFTASGRFGRASSSRSTRHPGDHRRAMVMSL